MKERQEERPYLHLDRSTTPTMLELTYIDGSLLLVSGEDPDLNVSLHQGLDSLRDTVLQLVLNRSGPEQLQVLQRSEELQISTNSISPHDTVCVWVWVCWVSPGVVRILDLCFVLFNS